MEQERLAATRKTGGWGLIWVIYIWDMLRSMFPSKGEHDILMWNDIIVTLVKLCHG
jgi:hypothetical protein